MSYVEEKNTFHAFWAHAIISCQPRVTQIANMTYILLWEASFFLALPEERWLVYKWNPIALSLTPRYCGIFCLKLPSTLWRPSHCQPWLKQKCVSEIRCLGQISDISDWLSSSIQVRISIDALRDWMHLEVNITLHILGKCYKNVSKMFYYFQVRVLTRSVSLE